MGHARKKHNAKRIKLTEDIIGEIKAEKNRTLISLLDLLQKAPKVPTGLSDTTIYNWLNGAQKTANADHLDFVLKTYKSLPSNEFVEIAPEIQKKLKAEISRTAVSSEQFFEIVNDAPDDFLRPSTINNLIVGKAQKIWRAHLNFVLEKYASLPAYQIQLTKALKQQLTDELLRTNVSIAAILDHPDKPKDMNMLKVQALMQGKLDEIPQKHWDFMIKRYANAPNVEMIHLTKADRDEFTQQLARTRMNYLRLSNHIKSKSGRKYKTTFLAGLHKGKQTNIQRTVWAEIMGCLKALPNAPASTGGIKKETRPTQNKIRVTKNKILITEEMRQKLNIELQRTGISIKSLLLGRPESLKALSSTKISNWKTGRLQTADKQEWDYVLHILSIFPKKNIIQ